MGGRGRRARLWGQSCSGFLWWLKALAVGVSPFKDGALEEQQVRNKCYVVSDRWVTAVVTRVPGLLSECRVLRAEH